MIPTEITTRPSLKRKAKIKLLPMLKVKCFLCDTDGSLNQMHIIPSYHHGNVPVCKVCREKSVEKK